MKNIDILLVTPVLSHLVTQMHHLPTPTHAHLHHSFTHMLQKLNRLGKFLTPIQMKIYVWILPARFVAWEIQKNNDLPTPSVVDIICAWTGVVSFWTEYWRSVPLCVSRCEGMWDSGMNFVLAWKRTKRYLCIGASGSYPKISAITAGMGSLSAFSLKSELRPVDQQREFEGLMRMLDNKVSNATG